MVIKNAERFGLSQLHQLRWRIGRADIQSYCFLETKNKTWDIGKRLKAMEDTNDGFKLAELDLQNRGAGEILWTMQSWESDIPLEILSDLKFLEKIQEGAKWLLEKYPRLEWLPWLKKYLEEKMGDVLA
jgi:ATP-dependent DNA helicase RecG